jgi:hypothetical protein
MVTREQMIDAWLEGKVPIKDETRKDFLLRSINLQPETALTVVDWLWNAGFNAGQENAIKEIQK